MDIEKFKVDLSQKIDIEKWSTKPEGDITKDKVNEELLPPNQIELAEWQEKLFAQNKQGLVVVFQAMDAAGKDSTIKKVFRMMDPQGVRVTSFKQPSKEELDRDYLWRVNKALPRRGEIGVFNRSHYEDVIVTRVHDLLKYSQLPRELIKKDIWDTRFREINDWELYLVENGFQVVKFYLHVSKDKQAERLLERVFLPEKNWKFNFSDINERRHWKEYRKAYEDMLSKTSTEYAPWYIIPADKKWYARYVVSEILLATLRKMNPQFPPLSKEDQDRLAVWRELLTSDPNLENILEKEAEEEKQDEGEKKELRREIELADKEEKKAKK